MREFVRTFLLQLSDVKAGGSTVFTELNVTVPVVKVITYARPNTKMGLV